MTASGTSKVATAPSWDELARTHWRPVLAHAHWLTGNQVDAEDLAQDVFMRALRALPAGTPTNLGGWLRRITRNLYLDRVRHQRKIHLVAFPDSEALGLRAAVPDAADGLDRRTIDSDVRNALEGLSAGTRAALVLRDIDGLTYDEVATWLGVGPGTVRSRIHRGHRHLRSALADRAPRHASQDTP